MRQKLGQHFLTNKSVLKKIAAVANPGESGAIIEIGPGHGELTDFLLAEGPASVVLLERDPELASRLREKYSGERRVEIKEGDALKLLPSVVRELGAADYMLVGNIPYYLTGFLLRQVGELESKPRRTVFTIQKEVAERIVAAPPRMNRLAAAVQFWARARVIANVSRKDFDPPPEVDSATIVLERENSAPGDPQAYYETLAAVFKQPRKTILNNLSDGLDVPKEDLARGLSELGLDPGLRPQDLRVEDVVHISRRFC